MSEYVGGRRASGAQLHALEILAQMIDGATQVEA